MALGSPLSRQSSVPCSSFLPQHNCLQTSPLMSPRPIPTTRACSVTLSHHQLKSSCQDDPAATSVQPRATSLSRGPTRQGVPSFAELSLLLPDPRTLEWPHCPRRPWSLSFHRPQALGVQGHMHPQSGNPTSHSQHVASTPFDKHLSGAASRLQSTTMTMQHSRNTRPKCSAGAGLIFKVV